MRLIICGLHRGQVYLLDADSDWSNPMPVWAWDVKNSTIPTDHHNWFKDILEVKCVNKGRDLLLCAGGKGHAIALIDVASKSVRFYAQVTGNIHSADLLPDGNLLAVGSDSPTTGSVKGFISVIATQVAGHDPLNPSRRTYPLENAHGVVWDDVQKCAWAHESNLGCTFANMVQFEYNGVVDKPELRVIARHPIAICNGHDLFPTADPTKLFLTDLGHIYLFDTKKFGTPQQLTEYPDQLLAAKKDVKGISELNGVFAFPKYIQALGWKSDTVVVYEPGLRPFECTLPNPPPPDYANMENLFYKVRWWPEAWPIS